MGLSKDIIIKNKYIIKHKIGQGNFGKISVVIISTSASGLSVMSPVIIPNEIEGYFFLKSDNFVLDKALIGAV